MDGEEIVQADPGALSFPEPSILQLGAFFAWIVLSTCLLQHATSHAGALVPDISHLQTALF